MLPSGRNIPGTQAALQSQQESDKDIGDKDIFHLVQTGIPKIIIYDNVLFTCFKSELISLEQDL